MYCVRVKKFLDTEQVQFFSRPMRLPKNNNHFDWDTGEILPNIGKPQGFLEYNPFTDECERMRDFTEPDVERSRAVSHARTIHKIYDIARSNHWEWFVTLTFNQEKVHRYDYSDCTKKLSQWLKNARKACPDMMYIVVPELHEDGAWHFHGLMSNCEGLNFVIAENHFDDEGRQIYNVGKYKYGWTTAVQIDDQRKTCSYITKYVTKEMCGLTKGKKHYWSSRNVKLPECVYYSFEDKFIRRKLVEMSSYVKSVKSEYVNVTYIELERGQSESVLF